MANPPLLSTLIAAFNKLLRGEQIETFEIGDTKHQLTLEIAPIKSSNTPSMKKLFTVFDLERMLESTAKKPDNHAGSVFTPSHIADAMVEYALDTWILRQLKKFHVMESSPNKFASLYDGILEVAGNNAQEGMQITHYILTEILPTMTLLDPCVGGGAFIRAFIRRLVWYHLVLNSLWPKLISLQIGHLSDGLAQISPKDQLAIYINVTTTIENHMFFVDIHSQALEVAMISVKTLLLALFPSNPSFLAQIRKLQFRALHKNAIEDPLESFPPHFHIIIGNPPYIGSDMMNRIFPLDERQKLKRLYKSVIKTGSKHDYYFYFVARGIDLLARGGILLYILPNRILSNDYAQKLRSVILQKTQLALVANFLPTANIFPEANVHPCILGLIRSEKTQKDPKAKRKRKGEEEREGKGEEKYWGGDITTLQNQEPRVLSLFQSQMHLNSLDIVQKYGIFFPSVSSEMEHILRKITAYPQLTHYLTIHEGTRMARIIPQIPSAIKPQISSADFQNLPVKAQNCYVGEIRGKNITRYTINDASAAIQYFLALPELLPEKSDMEREEKITQLSQPIVFIRELGDRVFAGLKRSPDHPIIGYGGVYFFRLADFHTAAFATKPTVQTLYAFLVYLSSSVFLKVYQTLFSAGKWGTALKFRSSYLETMPVIPFDCELFGEIGEMLSWLHGEGKKTKSERKEKIEKTEKGSSSMKKLQEGMIHHLEKIADYHLQSLLNMVVYTGPGKTSPKEDLKSQFTPIHILWNALDKTSEKRSEYEELAEKITQLHKSRQV